MVWLAWPVALGVLALDQGVKVALRGHLAPCTVAMALPTCARLSLLAGVTLVRAESNGGLPGLLPFFSLATLVALLGLLLIPLYARRLRHAGRLGALAVGLQVGGAVSNLADRLVFGASLDYLPVGHIVFNLADVALGVGMVLAVGLLAGRREVLRASPAPGRDAAEQAGSPGR